MDRRTWDIVFETGAMFNEVNDYYHLVSNIDKIIKKLHTEPDQSKRKDLYEGICTLHPGLFEKVRFFFLKTTKMAKDNGFSSVYQWVIDHEGDPLDWYDLVHNPEFDKLILSYAQQHCQSRKKELNLDHYHIWDFWFQEPLKDELNPYIAPLADSFENSLSIVESFFEQLGYTKDFRSITFDKVSDHPTYAQIHYTNEEKWDNRVKISPEGAGSNMGSLIYLSCIAHEAGHVIQSRQIQNPLETFYLPPNPLSEVISMFFEQLFLEPYFLNPHLPQNYKIDSLLRRVKEEQKLALIRNICAFHHQLILYTLLQLNRFEAFHLAGLNSELFRKYYGIEENDLNDHTWQRGISYLVGPPMRARVYLVGMVLSHSLKKHFMNTLEQEGLETAVKELHESIQLCSKAGSHTDWSTYEKACHLPEKLTGKLILKITKEILEI